jgi:uncharacterized protein YeaO (DUF488 family)
LAPSDILRQWFHQHRDAWQLFRKRYLKELAEPAASRALEELYQLGNGKKRLTLLFASKNLRYNNAVVLKELLEGMRKPPSGTGPGAARSLRSRQAQRMRM